MNYATRLSFPYSRLAAWVSRVAMASEKVIFYEHAGDPNNVHVHGLIVGFRKDKTTLKNWCKEALGMTPARTQWSFPERTKEGEPLTDGFISYMSKGKYDPSYSKGYTADEIQQWKAKGYDGKRKNDEKPDKNLAYYNAFEKWVGGEVEDLLARASESARTEGKGIFDYVRRLSYRFMMEQVMLPMPHDIARHKACVMRMCYTYEIPVPVESKYAV